LQLPSAWQPVHSWTREARPSSTDLVSSVFRPWKLQWPLCEKNNWHKSQWLPNNFKVLLLLSVVVCMLVCLAVCVLLCCCCESLLLFLLLLCLLLLLLLLCRQTQAQQLHQEPKWLSAETEPTMAAYRFRVIRCVQDACKICKHSCCIYMFTLHMHGNCTGGQAQCVLHSHIKQVSYVHTLAKIAWALYLHPHASTMCSVKQCQSNIAQSSVVITTTNTFATNARAGCCAPNMQCKQQVKHRCTESFFSMMILASQMLVQPEACSTRGLSPPPNVIGPYIPKH
jgi:hypothetical protein